MDDDPDLCMISKGMLEFLGYEAETALHGEETLRKFKAALDSGRPYLAVILDLTMNDGLNGLDVLRELKGIDPTVRAIVSSGHAAADDAQKYRDLGFAGILAKPYRSADVVRAIRAAQLARP